jgi:hypothetical protein
MELEPKDTTTRPCQICYSPYRKDIEKMVLKQKSTMKAAAIKYSKVMEKSVSSIYQSLQKHFGKKHYNTFKTMTDGQRAQSVQVDLNRDYNRAVTFEKAGQTLLEKGMEDVDELSTRDKLNMAAKMQKINLEGKKQELGESQLKLQVAKLFGGFIQKPIQIPSDDPGEVELEAEIVEDK